MSRNRPVAVPATSVPPKIPRPWAAPIVDSPRIEKLRGADPAALADFWAEVAREGSPLVEPDGDAMLLTFVWRERRPTRDVLVLVNKLADRHDLGGSARMRKLPGADLWHLTYRVRPDWQGSYHFAPDESDGEPPAEPDAAHWRAVAANLVADPLNPRVLPQPRPPHKSVAGRAAEPCWWAPRPEAPAGRVDEAYVTTELIHGPRRVWRYTPPGHRADAGPYPLLVLLDGDVWGRSLPVAPILDNLIAAGRIPPLVALLPDSVDRPVRFTEYACRPEFVEFLRTDLIEQAGRALAVTDDPARTVIAGQSLGGLTAAYAAVTAPDRFGNVLSQSGAYWWPNTDDPEWLTRQIAQAERRPVRWHVEVGLDEWVNLGPHRRLREVLTAGGYRLHYAEFAGGHDRLCWRDRLGAALIHLLGDEESAA